MPQQVGHQMMVAFTFVEPTVAANCDRFHDVMMHPRPDGRIPNELVAYGLAKVFEQVIGIAPHVELVETNCIYDNRGGEHGRPHRR